MVIRGVGTAAPPRRYAQRECWEAVQAAPHFAALSSRARAILRKVLTGDNGIAYRHLALEKLSDAFELNPDTLHRRFLETAPLLAAQAAEKALAKSGVEPQSIDALLVSTCTGYLCPGLTSHVSERLQLRADALMLDLVGQGCGAAIPNLRTAAALLRGGGCEYVLSVSVEICSAAFYLDEDPGVLISACLFGDGAGAAVLDHKDAGHGALKWRTSYTHLEPGNRDLLRFEQKNGMLRNLLSPRVPDLAADQATALLDQALGQAGLSRKDIVGWLFHPGGRDVLRAISCRLELPPADLRWSEAVLHEYGNVSSSSLFFVLESALNDQAALGLWWMSSFGAGFSCHGALLEFR